VAALAAAIGMQRRKQREDYQKRYRG